MIVCITGGPRTGTHLANSILCSSHRVPPMLAEALPLIDMLGAAKRAAGHHSTHGATLGVSLPQITELYADWLRGLATRMAQTFATDVVVFRGPLLAQHMDELVLLLQACGLPYRVIAMVRWPPDAVASLAVWSEKLRSNGKGGPIVRDASPAALAGFWMQYYTDLTKIARDQGLERAGISMVRYEDLVTAPENTVAGMGAFLGVDLSAFQGAHDWKNSLVAYTEDLAEFVTPLYGQAITSQSVGEGTKRFDDENIAIILNICRDIATEYYPERIDKA